MNRICIVGCSGSGKSTLARAMGERLGYPVHHLDAMFWTRGWVSVSREELLARIERVAGDERWIMDGNYGSTMPERFALADTVVFLDFPRRRCLWRIIARWLKYRGKTRPDMGEGCYEKMDLEFIAWVWNWPRNSRPKTLELIDRFRADGNRVVVLKTPREVAGFLEQVATGSGLMPAETALSQ